MCEDFAGRASSVTQDTAMILRQTLKTAEIQERHVKIQSNVVKACFTYQGTSWSFHSSFPQLCLFLSLSVSDDFK